MGTFIVLRNRNRKLSNFDHFFGGAGPQRRTKGGWAVGGRETKYRRSRGAAKKDGQEKPDPRVPGSTARNCFAFPLAGSSLDLLADF